VLTVKVVTKVVAVVVVVVAWVVVMERATTTAATRGEGEKLKKVVAWGTWSTPALGLAQHTRQTDAPAWVQFTLPELTLALVPGEPITLPRSLTPLRLLLLGTPLPSPGPGHRLLQRRANTAAGVGAAKVAAHRTAVGEEVAAGRGVAQTHGPDQRAAQTSEPNRPRTALVWLTRTFMGQRQRRAVMMVATEARVGAGVTRAATATAGRGAGKLKKAVAWGLRVTPGPRLAQHTRQKDPPTRV